MAMSFYLSFELPVTVARPFNTYGPRQSARAIIPTIITQIAEGAEEIKLGDLTPTRDFNYVKDTCKGFIALLENDNTIGKEVNIACNSEISMHDTLTMIKKIMKSNVRFVTDNERIRPKGSEVFRLWGDNSLIKELTDYEQEYSLQQGLEATIQWYTNSENLRKFKTNIYNL